MLHDTFQNTSIIQPHTKPFNHLKSIEHFRQHFGATCINFCAQCVCSVCKHRLSIDVNYLKEHHMRILKRCAVAPINGQGLRERFGPMECQAWHHPMSN